MQALPGAAFGRPDVPVCTRIAPPSHPPSYPSNTPARPRRPAAVGRRRASTRRPTWAAACACTTRATPTPSPRCWRLSRRTAACCSAPAGTAWSRHGSRRPGPAHPHAPGRSRVRIRADCLRVWRRSCFVGFLTSGLDACCPLLAWRRSLICMFLPHGTAAACSCCPGASLPGSCTAAVKLPWSSAQLLTCRSPSSPNLSRPCDSLFLSACFLCGATYAKQKGEQSAGRSKHGAWGTTGRARQQHSQLLRGLM